MASRPNVIYWNTIPSPYVVGRFNAVVARDNVALTALFNEERWSERSWVVDPSTWAFPASYVGNMGILTAARLFGRNGAFPTPDLLVSLSHTPAFIAGSMAARSDGARVAYRVLPTFDSWHPRSAHRELIKKAIFRTVDAVKVPGRSGSLYASRYGVPDNRIFPVTQSIDIAHFGRARGADPEVRQRRRMELGLTGTVFIYVGRLWEKKGIMTLLDAYKGVVGAGASCTLLIVGDGVDEDVIRARAATVPGVIFAGFVQPADLPEWYANADVFVFPTLGDPHGLVVEEAMAAGLPVISTAAAGDIRTRLPDGDAGYIVPSSDVESLRDRMVRFVCDPAMARRMGTEAATLVANRSHEQYAIDFERFVEDVMRLPRRTGPLPKTFSGLATLASSYRALPGRTGQWKRLLP